MVLNFYNNNTILAPLKCGTRYLTECFGEKSDVISIHKLNRNLHQKTIDTIVIRPPYEHLESALHTELLPIFDMDEVESMLQTFQADWNYPEGGTHWSPTLYEKLYSYWSKNKRYNEIKIIELKDLSNYLNGIQKNLPKYDSQKYNFNHYKNWRSKDDIILYVKQNYKTVWDNLMEQVEISKQWYELLIMRTPIKMILI